MRITQVSYLFVFLIDKAIAVLSRNPLHRPKSDFFSRFSQKDIPFSFIFYVAITQVELELQAVLTGTHPEFHYRLTGLKRRRDDAQMDAWRTFEVEAAARADAQFADDLLKTSLDRMKERLNADLLDKVNFLSSFS